MYKVLSLYTKFLKKLLSTILYQLKVIAFGALSETAKKYNIMNYLNDEYLRYFNFNKIYLEVFIPCWQS